MGISLAFPFPTDADLPLAEGDLLGRKLRKERHAHAGLQEGPEHEALPGALFVGGVEKPVDLRGRQPVDASRRSLRGREAHLFSGLGDKVLRLVVRVAPITEDLCDAANIALAIVVSARRARTGAVRTGVVRARAAGGIGRGRQRESERQALDVRVNEGAYPLDNRCGLISQLPSDHEETSRICTPTPVSLPVFGRLLRSLGLPRSPDRGGSTSQPIPGGIGR